MRYTGPKEKIERRLGIRLFLKGERCSSQKCAAVRRAYPPGIFGKKRAKSPSEFGRQLSEKKQLCAIYGITEAQCTRYVAEALRSNQDAGLRLLQLFETRLDNVVYQIGFAPSRAAARQMVSHGHFSVNGKRVTIPSYAVRKGDMVMIREASRDLPLFQNIKTLMAQRKQRGLSWLALDEEKFSGTIIGFPSNEDVGGSIHPQAIFEYFAR